MASAPPSPTRPLSPHLSIYRFHFSMALSILHRVAGVAMAGALVLLVAWLWAVAYSPTCFAAMRDALSSPVGRLVLLLASVVFYFKFASGLRHLLWDTGRAFSLENIDRSGVAILLFTAAATLLTWAIAGGIL